MFTGTPTPTLKLPQFEPGNHADFLTDFNNAFKNIDNFAGQQIQQYNQLLLRVEKLERDLKQTRIDAGLTNVNTASESEVSNGTDN